MSNADNLPPNRARAILDAFHAREPARNGGPPVPPVPEPQVQEHRAFEFYTRFRVPAHPTTQQLRDVTLASLGALQKQIADAFHAEYPEVFEQARREARERREKGEEL